MNAMQEKFTNENIKMEGFEYLPHLEVMLEAVQDEKEIVIFDTDNWKEYRIKNYKADKQFVKDQLKEVLKRKTRLIGSNRIAIIGSEDY